MTTWQQMEELVKHELGEHKECLRSLKKDLVEIKVEIARLKLKAGLWGLAGASIPVLLNIAIAVLLSFR